MAKKKKAQEQKSDLHLEDRSIQVLSTLRMKTIRLIESNSNLTIREGETLEVLNIQVHAPAMKRGELTDATEFAVYPQATVTAHPLNKPTGSSSMNIAVKMQCIYSSPLVLSNDEINRLCGVGLLAAWPQIRDLVLSLTMRMGLPPIVLPIMYADQVSGTIRMANVDHPVEIAAELP